ncbi:serine-rich adhesin for platelets-like isoform X2 [Haliotis rubra]|uniref:serine-rich adhesin for platelets-like isoform X2 n=1 Tax=Haliotis rubra TaxID=36100 RepID=UPI001EE56AA7|nr:serine-rich adhesin for platelets-like isoform X2 [Haliotis rubra]
MESPLETGQENANPITTDALVSPGKGEKYLWTKRATRHKPEYLDYTGGTANETHLAFTRPRNHTFLLEHKRLLVVAVVVVVIVIVVGAVVGGVLVSNKTEPQVSSTRTTGNPGTSSKSNLLTDLTSKSQPSSTSSISTEPPTSSISHTRTSPSASSSSLSTTVSTTSSASAVSSSPQSTTSPSTSTTSLLTSPVSTTTSTSAASPSSTSSTSTSISQSSTTATSSTTTITTSTVTTTTSSLPYLSMLDVTFNEGEDDLYLLCTISDDSKIIKVLFYKDGVQLKDDFIIGIHGRECSLTKKWATCSDSGDYECRVSGEFGTIKTTSTVNILVEPSKPKLKIKKIKLIDDAWEATLSCERRLGQPATSLHWRVLFNTGDIRENIFGAQSNTTTQEGCSSSVISQVTQRFMRSWDGAEICCYLTDAGGMTLNLEGCDVFTYTTGRVAVPRPTTYPDNCSLYYTCSGGVKQDATCTGSDIFSADPSKQACTPNPGDSYCAKVKANEVKVCTTTSK